MFEQGRYGRHSVAARVTDADGRDRRWRALKTKRDDCRLTRQSAAAIALVVDRASANGGTGGSSRIGFFGGLFLWLRLVGIAPDAEEEEEELAMWVLMEGRMLTQASRVGRVSWKRGEGMFTRGELSYGRPMAGLAGIGD